MESTKVDLLLMMFTRNRAMGRGRAATVSRPTQLSAMGSPARGGVPHSRLRGARALHLTS